MLLGLRTLGIKSDVRRLFVHDNTLYLAAEILYPKTENVNAQMKGL